MPAESVPAESVPAESPAGSSSRRETVAVAAATAVGAGFLLAALTFPVWSGGRPGPGLFPLIVGGIILVSAIVELVRRLVSPAPAGASAGAAAGPAAGAIAEDDAEAERDFGPLFWKVPALVGCLVGYVVVVELLGHLLSSALLTWLALLVVGGRPWWQQAGLAVVFSAASYAVFDLLLGVPLPGWGF